MVKTCQRGAHILTLLTLVLWRVDFSVSSCDLPGGENVDGDIFKDDFQLKYFNLFR